MSARQRKSNENGVFGGEAQKRDATSHEDSLRRARRSRRAAGTSPYERQLLCIRWSIVVVVLLLVALAVTYYYTRIYEPLKVATEERGREGEAGGAKRDGDSKKKPTSKSDEVGKKKQATKTDSSKKSSTSKKEKNKTKKPASKNRIPTIAMEDLRLLRRPIAPGDADRPYIIEILNGDNLLLEKRYSEALEKFNEILKMFPQSPRGLFGKGETLTGLAREKTSNKLMETAIEFYQDAADSFLATHDLKVAALARLADLCQERVKAAAAVSALEKLYSLDSDDRVVANRLGAAYTKTGQLNKAEEHFRKLLNETPDNFYAKAYLGYVRFRERRYEEALPLLLEGIRRDESIGKNARFYLYAGESFTRLNRSDEAQVLYGEAVSRDLFPSLYQRSLVNEPGLRATPWWTVEETGYQTQIQPLLRALSNITSEVIPALLGGGSQTPPKVFPVYSHGKKNAENCRKLPLTCSLLDSVPESTSCKHGEVKFIVVPPKSHVPPHTGATNTRLVVLAGLSLGEEGELEIRLAEETRVLREGEVLVFDDSFEQESQFASLRPGLVLSMDVWHPDLSPDRRKRLTPVH